MPTFQSDVPLSEERVKYPITLNCVLFWENISWLVHTLYGDKACTYTSDHTENRSWKIGGNKAINFYNVSGQSEIRNLDK